MALIQLSIRKNTYSNLSTTRYSGYQARSRALTTRSRISRNLTCNILHSQNNRSCRGWSISVRSQIGVSAHTVLPVWPAIRVHLGHYKAVHLRYLLRWLRTRSSWLHLHAVVVAQAIVDFLWRPCECFASVSSTPARAHCHRECAICQMRVCLSLLLLCARSRALSPVAAHSGTETTHDISCVQQTPIQAADCTPR